MWPFSKPKKSWSAFRPAKQCNECGRLEKPSIWSFPNDNCPDCGSKDVKEVIARWEYSYGFADGPTYYRSEVREAAKKETA